MDSQKETLTIVKFIKQQMVMRGMVRELVVDVKKDEGRSSIFGSVKHKK